MKLLLMLKKILSITCKVFIKEECLYQHEFFTYYITISVCSFIKSESVFCMVYFVAYTNSFCTDLRNTTK